MTGDAPPSGVPASDQTFLVGPTLFLRPVALTDAPTAPAWLDSPYPLPAPVVEERLKERLGKGQDEVERRPLLLICERHGGRPVGSVDIPIRGWRMAHPAFVVDPMLPEQDRQAILQEALEIVIGWLLDERNLMGVFVELTAGQPGVAGVVAARQGRLAATLRQFRFEHGRRIDLEWYQFLSPHWVERLGEPPMPQEGPVEREVRAPARPPVTVPLHDRPPDAIAIGERVYLHPFRPDDGAKVEAWSLVETEIVFPEGRWVVNAHAYGRMHETFAKDEPPETIRFGISLRESQELIGATGFFDIDWVHRTAETEMDIFHRDFRGQGIGTEAKHLLLGYAFDRIGLHAVYSYVSDTNPRSAAAQVKQGFRPAGYLAWDAFSADGFAGGLIFDLLAEEWRAARDDAAR